MTLIRDAENITVTHTNLKSICFMLNQILVLHRSRFSYVSMFYYYLINWSNVTLLTSLALDGKQKSSFVQDAEHATVRSPHLAFLSLGLFGNCCCFFIYFWPMNTCKKSEFLVYSYMLSVPSLYRVPILLVKQTTKKQAKWGETTVGS